VLRGELTRDTIIDELKKSGLRGRRCGLPAGVKMSFMPRTAPMQKYLVCNSDESEPGTCHDRDILRYNPHALVEGWRSRAMRSARRSPTTTFAAIHGEPIPRFEAALKEAYAAGLLGKNIRGSGIDQEIYTFVGAGAYICGEETALLESLEGKQGKPRFKPPFPANYAFTARDDDQQHTERRVVATILRKAHSGLPTWASKLGRNGDLFDVGPRREAVTTSCRSAFRSRAARDRRGVRGGRKLKAVIPAARRARGAAEKMMTLTMDFDTVKARARIGHCATIVMDETTCMVRRCAGSRVSITPSRAGSARRAARARDGSTAC